jgi:putative transposase
MFPGDVGRQTPRALLAPFQGAAAVWAWWGVLIRWLHHRLISLVPPARNLGRRGMDEAGFSRASGTIADTTQCLEFHRCHPSPDLKRSCMASTHLSLHYHLVFSTKNREPWLSPTHRQRVHAYIGGIIRNMDGVAHAVGGTGDHIHIAAGLRATHCLADVMREVKSESSRWIHEELRLAGFAWQEGYGAFTFAAPDLEAVRAYVLNQEEHHRVKTFQEEYVAMLKRGMVAYEERFLW